MLEQRIIKNCDSASANQACLELAKHKQLMEQLFHRNYSEMIHLTRVLLSNNEVRGLHFRFVWNPQKGIDQVVSDLNLFERLNVTLNENQITVK